MVYYIKHNFIFSDRVNHYDIDLFQKTVQEAGGRNCDVSRVGGRRNAARVVTFDALSEYVKQNIQIYLDKLSVFQPWGCYIAEKDW